MGTHRMAVMQACVMSLCFAAAVASASLRGTDLPGTGTSTDSSNQTSKLVLANLTTRNNVTTSAPERSLKGKQLYSSSFKFIPGDGKYRGTSDVPDAYRRASSYDWAKGAWVKSDWVKGDLQWMNTEWLANSGGGPGAALYRWEDVPSYEDAEYLLVATGKDGLYIDRAEEITTKEPNGKRMRKAYFGVKDGGGWVLSLDPDDGNYWGVSARTCYKFDAKNSRSNPRWSTFPCRGISGP